MKLNVKNLSAKLVSTAIGAAAGAYVASGMTMTVLGATAVPGAIKTTTTVINGKTMVLSVIKAGLFSKILSGLLVTAIVGGVTYYVYKENKDKIMECIDYLKNKSKDIQDEFNNKVEELQNK